MKPIRGRGSVRPHEEQDQCQVIEWAAIQLPLWGLPRSVLFAVPNGAHLSSLVPGQNHEIARMRRVQRLRQMGMLDGAADLLLTVARGFFHGMWIEMKKRRELFRSERERERAWREEQRIFCETQRAQGYEYRLCYGFDEAKQAITEYVLERGVYGQMG